MPRKKGASVGSHVLLVRVNERIDQDLHIAAEGLGIDISNLVRMVLIEQLPTYIERGIDARKRAEAAREKAAEAEDHTGKSKKEKPVKRGAPRVGHEVGDRYLDGL
jgi:antitoxin component of RelBE/YafQ-DinJ toxin-antitoxin module